MTTCVEAKRQAVENWAFRHQCLKDELSFCEDCYYKALEVVWSEDLLLPLWILIQNKRKELREFERTMNLSLAYLASD